MKREFYKQFSKALNQDVSMIVYGEGGYPVIAFQTQDSKSDGLENFGMVDTLADYIDGGRIQLFSVDNVDEQSWSPVDGDKAERAQRQEDYFRFVTDELVPRVHAWNNSDLRPLAIGCSMGATHAAIAALRRPDLFQGCIALSGVYRSSYFFGDWMNDTLYNNDVTAFLPNMSKDHPYVDLYHHRPLVFCVGQGAWEDGIDDVRQIDGQLTRLGVDHWCDIWGTDVNHDWVWWKKQIRYFLPLVLDDIDRELAGERDAAAKAEAKAKAKATPKPAARKAEPAPAAKPAGKAAAGKAAKAARPTASRKSASATKPAAKKSQPKAAAKPAAKARDRKDEPRQSASMSAVAEKLAGKPSPKKATAKAATTKAATTKAVATKPATAKATAAKAKEEVAKKPAKATTKTAAKPSTKTTIEAAAKSPSKTPAKAAKAASKSSSKVSAKAATKTPATSAKPAAKAATRKATRK